MPLYGGNSGNGDAFVANTLAQFAATTSAELAGVISNETGTGALVFGTSPTISTPTITGAITLSDDTRQVFNPGGTNAGLNVGAFAGDPSTPVNGDLWYDSVSNELTTRINGINVALGTAGGGGDALVANPLSQFAATTSAQLAGVISDETGTGLVVFATSPTITTPTISGAVSFQDDVRQTFNPGASNAGLNVGTIAGDPSSPINGDLWYDSTANELNVRINGVSVSIGAGGIPTTITVGDTADATCFVGLFESATGDLAPKTDGALLYNASTGKLTVPYLDFVDADMGVGVFSVDNGGVFRFYDLAGTNEINFLARTDTNSVDQNLYFPITLPSAGQVLTASSVSSIDVYLGWSTPSGGGDALVANPLSQFAATTSAQLAGVLSDETGTDKAVFNTSPGFATAANPISNDGAALGTTALGWSDLHLATGSLINVANGNAVITHSSGIFTVSTGDLRVTTAGTNASSVLTLDGTQTTANKTLTAPMIAASTMSGSHQVTGRIYSNLDTLTDGATITIDFSLGNKFTVTLGGNRTVAFSNDVAGQVVAVRLKQDGTGSRTITWPSGISWAGGSAPTLTTDANKADWIVIIPTTAGSAYDGSVLSQNH